MILPDDKLAALLVEGGLIDKKKLEELAEKAKITHTPLFNELLDAGALTDEQIGQAYAKSVQVPFIVLSKVSLPEDVFHIIPEKIARKHRTVAFARDKDGVKVAMADPKKSDLLDMVVKKTNQKVTVYYATDRDIDSTLQIYKKVLQKTIDELLKEDIKKATRLVSDDLPIAKSLTYYWIRPIRIKRLTSI